MLFFIYACIAGGFHDVTGKFWASLFWPSTLGEILAKEAKKRGAVE